MKYKYNRDDVITNRKEYYNFVMDNYKPVDIYKILGNYLELSHKFSLKDFIYYCYNNDVNMQVVQKNYSIIRDLVKEHNKEMELQAYKEYHIDKKYMAKLSEWRKENQALFNLANVFDKFSIETEDSKITLLNIKKEEKKNET